MYTYIWGCHFVSTIFFTHMYTWYARILNIVHVVSHTLHIVKGLKCFSIGQNFKVEFVDTRVAACGWKINHSISRYSALLGPYTVSQYEWLIDRNWERFGFFDSSSPFSGWHFDIIECVCMYRVFAVMPYIIWTDMQWRYNDHYEAKKSKI